MTRMAAHSSRIRPRCHCMQIDRSRAHISLYRRHVTFNSKASSPPGGTRNGFNWIEVIIRQHRPLAVCKWHNRVERAGLNIRLHLHTPVKRIRPPRGIIARYFFFFKSFNRPNWSHVKFKVKAKREIPEFLYWPVAWLNSSDADWSILNEIGAKFEI